MNRNEIELFVKNYIRAYLLQIREQIFTRESCESAGYVTQRLRKIGIW